MNQFNIIDIYMKIVNEKEKKLQEALNQLNSLEIQDQNLLDEIKNLNEQKILFNQNGSHTNNQ